MHEVEAQPVRGRKALRFLALTIVLIIAVAALGAILFRNTAALAVLRSVARGFGYEFSAGALDVNLNRGIARDVNVRNAAGEPVLDARQIDVAYSLRDLLPGGKRLFGLESVDVEAPHVTVIHHADGSYNITVPRFAPGPARPSPAPLNVRLRVTGGVVDLVDRFVSAPHERRERLSQVHADGIVSPASGSYYHAGAELEDGTARYPIVGNARFDDPRGFEIQHWTAAQLPIAKLADFALSSHAVVVQAGELRDLDVKLGALALAAGGMASHLSASGNVTGVRIAAAVLTKPIRDAHGSFVVDDDSATLRSLDAALNGIPLHLRGALYHFAAPRIAFGLTSRGDLAAVGQLLKNSVKLPLNGAVALQGLAEGSASQPLIFARVDAPRIRYGTYRFDGARGFAAISGNELDVIDAAIRYGPLEAAARGTLRLEQRTRTNGYATLTAPANGLPYVANLLPGMALSGIAAVAGTNAQIGARGYLAGTNGPDRLDAPFAIAAGGDGTVGPVVLQRRDGASVYARAVLDAHAHQTVGLVDVHALSLLPAPAVALPGIAVPALPPHLDAKLDATLTGIAAGTATPVVSGALHAYGSWGDLSADADGSAAGLAARGRLTSSFERLAAFTGNVGAHGGIEVPFALVSGRQSTILQIQDASFADASIRGVALQAASATLGIALPAVKVYAADVRVADHDITAAGSFGDGGRIGLTAADLDLRQVRAAGVAISGGRATVIADIGGTTAKPTANVFAALGGARYANTDLGGDVALAYDGAALRIDSATLTYGGAYANAAGAVSGLTLGHIAPRYDLRAQLEDADIATLARSVKNSLPYPAGTLDADLRITGAGATPTIAGDIAVPEGSINGLNFRAARVGVAGNASAIAASGGQVTVGSTTLDFAGSASRARQQVTLRSNQLDLADFDDYFNDADVLAGTGSIALAFDATPRALNASANVALNDTRYRRFDLGTVRARVSTLGTAVQLAASVDGSNGRANVAGNVTVPAVDPLRDIVRRSDLDLQAQIAGVNLGNVLPAAGLSAPVLGIVDGAAVVRGRYPALALTANAALTNGVAGRIPIERFTIAATAANGRGRLTDLSLAVPGLSANVTGSFGVRPEDAFDLHAQATSANLNTLVSTATGKSLGISGTLATAARVSGTLAVPHVTGTLDAGNLTYRSVTIPAAHAAFDATRRAVEVRDGTVTLPRGGSITFDGRAPLGGGASSTPVALDFTPRAVDVNPYSSLLPDGSVLDGIFDGSVGLRGTIAAPQLNGNLAFTNGSYRSNTLKGALTDITLDLNFSGTTVRVEKLHARAAPGNIDGTGTLALRDLHDPIRGLSANLSLTLADARIAAPKYYTGSVDGILTAKKRAGAPGVIGGSLTLSKGRIPYTALLPSGAAGPGATPALPNLAFNLGVTAGRDVRVQSGPVDIGATGMANLGGTLARPTLAGQFTATDGTVTLYRTFKVQNGSAVTFSPGDGLIPTVDATAVTNVPDPPTDVLLRVTGLATHLQLAFSSQPAYTQEQILGLLVNAQALGAVSGVAQTNGSGSALSGASIVGIGAGVVNTQLTQMFLQPFTSQLGSALGLSDLSLNYNLNGSVSASARKVFGKNLSFTYGTQIGGPQPQALVGVNIGTSISGAQLTFYQAAGSQQAFGGQSLTPFLQSGYLATQAPNYTLQAIAPPTGSGFVFSYVRRFW